MNDIQALMTLLMSKLHSDRLLLPTLPEIAVKVRSAADDPDINLQKMAQVISHDPALSARILKVANSAFIGRSIVVTTLVQAVTRIGLMQVKNIATAMALEQLFVSHQPDIAQLMQLRWRQSVEITTSAMALLQLYQLRQPHSSQLDVMTLAALLAGVGDLPLLAEAERHPALFADTSMLEQACQQLSNPIAQAILQQWRLPSIFSAINAAHGQLLQGQPLDVLAQDAHLYATFIMLGKLSCGLLPIAMAEQISNLAQAHGLIEQPSFSKDDAFTQMKAGMAQMFAS